MNKLLNYKYEVLLNKEIGNGLSWKHVSKYVSRVEVFHYGFKIASFGHHFPI